VTSPDPTFPRLHIRPARGWLNDPNGLCLIDGRYHVFFQYNPDAPLHRDVIWGHVSSTDLVHWIEHPPGLLRRPGSISQVGCWTGCIVDDEGVPTAVYTAVHDHPGNAVAALARSDRSLIDWAQDDHGVMDPPDDPTISDVRDPFVFVHDGRRYVIQGAGRAGGEPSILLYGADRLDSWTELGRLIDYSDPLARELAPSEIWECPNLALIDGRWVLILSLWDSLAGGPRANSVSYLVGDLVADGPGLHFVAESGGQLDVDGSFYAPQLVALPDRTLLWGWARELGRTQEEIDTAGWAGVLTFPRELSVVDGVLLSRPARELTALRQGPLDPTQPIREPAFELTGTLTPGRPLTLALRADLSDVGRPTAHLSSDKSAEARILVDGSMVEVYVEGQQPQTLRAYPTSDSAWHVTGDATDLTGWRLALS
jgi:beta-fructofuranosidase